MKDRNEPRDFNWKEMPMLRLLLPMATGIAAGVYWRALPEWAPVAGMSFGCLGCLLLTRKKIPYRLRHGYAIACLFFWTWTGVWLSREYVATNRADYFLHQPAPNPVWVGKVTETGGSAFPRAIIRINGYYSPFTPARGKALVYTETPLEKGQVLLFKAAFREIPPPKNPGGFDNKRYRFFQNVHHQAYLKEGDYEVIGKTEPHFLERWRDSQVAVWKEHLKDTSVYSVATAMVLGYTAELPDEVRDTYAQTGATHVLSVSGLHVGLIYLMLTGLLRRWQSVRLIRKLNFVICLLGIWAFAFLTGAGPAVLRAATMFSFVLAGNQLGRSISIFNSLAASAFFLLWVNPLWLFHIGFQLSYTALAGIVVFQPLFYRLWIPANTWADKIWTLITVSLGAQLATLPLTMHYFHQFPVYFWLSGLVVVPASPFIIGLGILLTLAHYLAPGLVWIPALLLKTLVQVMNAVLEWMQHLPFSLVENLFFPKAAIIILVIAVFLLAWIWEQGRQRALPWLLLALNGFAVARFYTELRIFTKEELIVYFVPGGSLMDYFHRGNLLTLKSERVSREMEERAAGIYRKQHRVFNKGEWLLPGESGFINTGCLWMQHPGAVVLYGSPEMDLTGGKARTVVADASNRKREVERWKKECDQAGIPFVDIREEGAFVISFRR